MPAGLAPGDRVQKLNQSVNTLFIVVDAILGLNFAKYRRLGKNFQKN